MNSIHSSSRRFTGTALRAVLAGIIFLAAVFSVSALSNTGARSGKADFIISNGTGKVISEVEIRPSAKQFRENRNICVLSGLSLGDKESLPVFLPAEMSGLGAYDVILKYGKKTAKTRKSVTVNLAQGMAPHFVAHIDGKPSTIPMVAGGISGGSVAATIGGAAAYCVAHWGAGGLAWLLALPGSMVAGMGIAVAAPVLVTVGVFTAVQLLSADTLILTQVNG